ncbi:hypothetical protein UFOVP181_318 [uncultured Caudovirales phage]|uniref:Uncharacterized protein n=1 Tax=uncultured Caudovirales phage TaxID=2100421 RepID=A0A6J5L0L4_9CAUD|nr:hypothetical protein UFOVP57_321 [uncultured Caudovirales phage]CAB5209108.1 hypothetical protein UFOVP181_318 [uncultured Caudovirales phage]
MSNIIKVIEQDIIFLSYDEPNAEKNYADLLSKFPWAKRVHGVKGSDAAHKACAALSDTEYFVTVDADNIVDPKFQEVEIDLDALGLTSENVFSWCGKVHVNGLMYGNGGLKLWTRKFVNEMKTHENSDPTDTKGKVEFCFDDRYYQFNESYSESFTNATPFQAWRAGFREGVKMSLDQGAKTTSLQGIWWQNYHRLLIWSSVGADVENGIYSILGAREGAAMTNCTDWDYSNVRDFEWLTTYWAEHYETASDEEKTQQINFYGKELKDKCGLEIANLDPAGSKFFKTVYSNSPRIIRKRV